MSKTVVEIAEKYLAPAWLQQRHTTTEVPMYGLHKAEFIEAINQLLIEAKNENVIRQRVIDADNIYTDEHDRKLWNKFKEIVLGDDDE